MNTLLGEIPDDQLQKEETAVDCPVGKVITTRYFFEGELVRQDARIEVTRAPAIGSKGGLFPKG